MKQDKTTYNHGKVVKIYIVYEISRNINISDYRTLENCLFGAVSLTKNADIDKYRYSEYGIVLDRSGFYSHHSDGTGRNVIIFGVDISPSAKIDNRKKDILVIKVLHEHCNTHRVQKKCIQLILQSIIKSFVWPFILMEQIVIHLLMVQKFINLKQKIRRLKQLHYF